MFGVVVEEAAKTPAIDSSAYDFEEMLDERTMMILVGSF